MKILFITRGRSSRGGHVIFTNIVRELRRDGYDVTLTTFESREDMKMVVPYWENIDVNFVEIEGKSILEKLFNNLILSDWVSYYLAKEYKIDPAPVEIVEEFKKKLKE